MKLYKSECLYDAEKKQWIEKFWINDEEVDAETYFNMIDVEKDIEDKKLEDEEGIVCDDNCEQCQIPDEACRDIQIIEDFSDRIENAECDCGSCLRNILYELLVVGKEIGYENCKEHIKDCLDISNSNEEAIHKKAMNELDNDIKEFQGNIEGKLEEFDKGDIYNITFNINCEKEFDAEQIFKQINDGLKKVGI